MLGILLILLILFLIGLPFYWLYKLVFKNKKLNSGENDKIIDGKSDLEVSDLIENQKYLFMDDFRMWKSLSEIEKKERLTDIQVIFDYGKELITKEMIKKGFKSGSKIIDIKYFTGLSEFGTTITSFLIQHKDGGEIRALTIKIDLKNMKFTASHNQFHSTGKERYYYLKDRKEYLMKI